MSGDATPPAGRRPFRWQALLHRASEVLFVLDRRRRVLFVNPAWERLTGVPADRVRGLLCRRPRPVGPDDSTEDLLAHILTPPPEALAGQVARTRRLFSPRGQREVIAPAWWDVEYFPLRQGGEHEGYLFLGRIIPVAGPVTAGSPLLPERLEGLRLKRVGGYSFELLASATAAVRQVAEQARLASQVRVPVLLVGEAGTGKQTVARLIHYHSPKRELAFAALDCRVLPPALVAEVVLAERSCPAWRALGAVFLADPASLPRDLQVRLCEWLGAGHDGGPRLFASLPREASEEVKAGRLVEELAWRLGTLTLQLPPLRERLEDLPRLVTYFLDVRNSGSETPIQGLTPAATEALRAYAWPGNLTELRRLLVTATAAGGLLDVGDLPLAVRLARQAELDPRPAARSLDLEATLEQVERRLILLALARARGNRSRAAELLGIHRPRLLRRLEALKITEPTSEFESD